MNTMNFSLIILAALGCSSQTPDAVWEVLPGAGIALPLPPTASVKRQGDSIRIEMRAGYRTPRPLSLTPASALTLSAEHPHERSAADTRLTWSDAVQTGGMGGPERQLKGVLFVGEQSFHVTCSDQQEGTPPTLDWCIDTLLAARSQ